MKKLLVLLVSVMLCTILMVAASAEATFINPVAPGADPFVFKDDDGTYYLYVTSGDTHGYRVFTSKNLVEWEGEGYCLVKGDVFDDPDVKKDYANSEGVYEPTIQCFWAPEVIKYEGKYYMVYTYQQHIGFAVSDSPYGPFVNSAESYLLDNQTIDGHFFLDDGTMYLYFVTETAVTMNGQKVKHGNNIWGCILDMDTLTIDEDSLTLLVRWNPDVSSEYRNHVVEGPAMLKHNGRYYLTFSSGGYKSTDYSVHCATSDKPLGINVGDPLPAADASGYATGTFTRDYNNIVLISDDLDYADNENEHLYGTAHHSFTTSPDGKDLYIVYHAHRTGWGIIDESKGRFSPRVTCIDKAWFDEDGILRAGTVTTGTPTAGEQPLPSGAVLERETHYEGVFANVSENTIYVAHYDGLDTNDGLTDRTPVQTVEKAAELLKETGGTIAIIQDYVVTTGDTTQYLDIPACDAPLIIKAADEKDKDILFDFKFMSINSDVYFDNLILVPGTREGISVIECNFNNVVFGDGISTLFTPTRREFPYIVGGNWWYTGANSNGVYDNFKYNSEAEVTSDAEYAIHVCSGTWEKIVGGSMKGYAEVEGSAPNGMSSISMDVIIRPEKVSDVATKTSSAGTVVTFDEVDFAEKYQVLRNGEVVGYSDTNRFVDESRELGGTDSYTVRAYANGCCIGEVSANSDVTTYGDIDRDGVIGLADALKLLDMKLKGTTRATLLDVLVLLNNI